MAAPFTDAQIDAAFASGVGGTPVVTLIKALVKQLNASVGAGGGGGGSFATLAGLPTDNPALVAALNGRRDAEADIPLVEISGVGTAAELDFAATGDAAADEVVTGDDSRLADARKPLGHQHAQDDVADLRTALGSLAADTITFQVAAPVAGTIIVLEEYADWAGTIDALTHRLASGTASLKVQRAAADVAGLASISPTATRARTLATTGTGANNAQAVGDRIALVVTSATDAGTLYGTLRRTRTLPAGGIAAAAGVAVDGGDDSVINPVPGGSLDGGDDGGSP